MAVILQQLLDEVLKFSVKSNETLSRFSYPEHFVRRCKSYLRSVDPLTQQRFSTLNFDGLIVYNYHKGPVEQNFNDCTSFATVEDVKDWQTAIKCLQRYCLNLLLAPRRQDFHQIKVNACALTHTQTDPVHALLGSYKCTEGGFHTDTYLLVRMGKLYFSLAIGEYCIIQFIHNGKVLWFDK